VDVVAWERRTNDLLIAQVKAFITPDTVEDVIRANEKLEEGLGQIARARRWISEFEPRDFEEKLRMPFTRAPRRVQYAVIGNGFAGSDYLPIEPDVPVVDARFLLLPRFRGGSIIESIGTYGDRLATVMRDVGRLEEYRELSLGPIRVEIPAREIVI